MGEECGASQISCDAGTSYEGCWYGNYCIDMTNSWDNCPGICSTNCNWDTEEWCDMGVDSNGCCLGNYCQDINAGGCPVMTKRGSMEKLERLQPGLTGLPLDLDTVLLDLDTVPLDRGTPLVLALTKRYVGTKCSS